MNQKENIKRFMHHILEEVEGHARTLELPLSTVLGCLDLVKDDIKETYDKD